ncbi:unnamed protein product [Closterium sp. NIES-53]
MRPAAQRAAATHAATAALCPAEQRCPGRAAPPSPSRPPATTAAAAVHATAAGGGGAAGSAGGAAARPHRATVLLLLLLLLLVLLPLVVEVRLGELDVLLVLESAVAPGGGESAAAVGARESADALGASVSTTTGPASAEALHTFTLDSGASRCFVRDCTTVTRLAAPVRVSLADPTDSRDFPVLGLHSDRGGEFSSDLLAEFCRDEGIRQSFTLPASPQQNGIAKRRIGLIMEVARTYMIHAAAAHFPCPFAVRYAAHQLNLWPRVSEPETSPTLRWTGKVGDASVFWVWGALSLVRDAKPSKLSSRTLRCVFLGFPTDALPWQFHHLRERRVFSSEDVTFDESVYFYRLHLHASHPGPAPSGVSQVDPPPLVEPLEISSDSSGPAEGGNPAADNTAASRRSPRLESPLVIPPRPSSPPLQPAAMDFEAETAGAEPGGAETEGEGSGCAATGGAATGGAATGGADSGGAAIPSGGGAVGDTAGGPEAGQPPPGGGGYGPVGARAATPGGTAGAGGTSGGAGGAAVLEVLEVLLVLVVLEVLVLEVLLVLEMLDLLVVEVHLGLEVMEVLLVLEALELEVLEVLELLVVEVLVVGAILRFALGLLSVCVHACVHGMRSRRGRGRGGRGGGAANMKSDRNESESRDDRFPGQFFFVSTQALAGPEKDEGFEEPAAEGKVTLHSLDYWVIDSGATYSMTPRADLLTELEPSPVKHVTSALGQQAEVKGMGKAMFKGADGKMVGLKNVLWVTNLAANLISVRRLQKAGMDTSLKGAKTYTARIGERILWDLHEDRDVYNEMWQIPVVPMPRRGKWQQCTLSFVLGTFKPIVTITVVMDVVGPLKLGAAGAEYFLTIVDVFTHMTWVYVLSKKSDVAETMKTDWLPMVERQQVRLVKSICTDRGEEFLSKEFGLCLKKNGIRHSLTFSYSPGMNGFAERANRTITETARGLLIEVGLPDYFWPDAVRSACVAKNRALTHAGAYEWVPYVDWIGRKPKVDMCMALVPKHNRHNKLGAKPIWAVHLGMAQNSKGWLLWDPFTKNFLVSRDCTFIENLMYKDWKAEKEAKISEVKSSTLEHVKLPLELSSDSTTTRQSSLVNGGKEAKDAEEEEEEVQQVSERAPTLHSCITTKSALAKAALMVGDDEESNYEECTFSFFSPVEMPGDPATLKEALESSDAEEWKQAMETELKCIEENSMWEFVELPEGLKSITSKWLFKIKSDADCKIERYKSRLVAKRYQQKEKVDYKVLFAPLVKPMTLRTLLAGATIKGRVVKQIDVTTAFLNGVLEEVIFMEQPEGFDDGSGRVLKMKKALYGLKQAPRK